MSEKRMVFEYLLILDNGDEVEFRENCDLTETETVPYKLRNWDDDSVIDFFDKCDYKHYIAKKHIVQLINKGVYTEYD